MTKYSELRNADNCDIMTITDAQFFVATNEHENDIEISVNIIIDDKFLIQLDNDNNFSIPSGNEYSWNSCEDQNAAYDQYQDIDEIINTLKLSANPFEIYSNFGSKTDIYATDAAKMQFYATLLQFSASKMTRNKI